MQPKNVQGKKRNMSSLPDQVIIYDQTYNTAVGANAFADLPELNAGEKLLDVEELWSWPPIRPANLADGQQDIQIFIDGKEYPSTMHLRSRWFNNMMIPRDDRYGPKPIKFGLVDPDPILNTTVKVTPAERISLRLNADAVGIVYTGTASRVMLIGRVYEDDSELQDAYGVMYQPGGPTSLTDRVTKKTTPTISKSNLISLNNSKSMSGAILQNKPSIYPMWTWSLNSGVINPAPEYEYSYRSPANVAQPFMDLRFDWTRITNKALIIKYLGAVIGAGRGNCWFLQDSKRRPGSDSLFNGWIVNSAYPNMLPPGVDIPHLYGPLDLMAIGPAILAHNSLTEFRVIADPGTTIAANNLEIQMRGTFIEW